MVRKEVKCLKYVTTLKNPATIIVQCIHGIITELMTKIATVNVNAVGLKKKEEQVACGK